MQDKPFGVNLTILPALIPAELWPHMTIVGSLGLWVVMRVQTCIHFIEKPSDCMVAEPSLPLRAAAQFLDDSKGVRC